MRIIKKKWNFDQYVVKTDVFEIPVFYKQDR